MGFYEDPYSDFDRLAMELRRATRLVADTGLHDKQWTREEAIERYVVMPGQATAYTVGMLKTLDLRDRASEALGEDFGVRAFHDVVLKDGAAPLAILEENVNAWVKSQTDA